MMSENTLSKIISSLPLVDISIVNSLHETAAALGYMAKISPIGKKTDNWKCEYIATKPKRVLYILRVTEQRFSVHAKLFHIAEYNDVLENCTEHCKDLLISNSGDCGHHGGSCKGPISFVIRDESYAKCRHSIIFTDIVSGDVEGIQRLLQSEAQFS